MVILFQRKIIDEWYIDGTWYQNQIPVVSSVVTVITQVESVLIWRSTLSRCIRLYT